MKHYALYLGRVMAAVLCALPASSIASTLIACGSQEIRMYDTDRPAAPMWRWNASERHDGLPDAYRHGLLDHIDECKPVQGNRAILSTASSGATVLIDVKTGRVEFFARTPMAHSAELLPDHRVVVADSLAEAGNRLEVYDLSRSEQPLFHVDLHAGHGALWQKDRHILYALGDEELRAYALIHWESTHPGLKEVGHWPLPSKNGHDLSPIPGQDAFVITTDEKVWRFNLPDHRFSPFSPLQDRAGVKAVSIHPFTGQIAFQQTEESWWSYRVSLLSPTGDIPMGNGMRLYKVRWLIPRASIPGKGESGE